MSKIKWKEGDKFVIKENANYNPELKGKIHTIKKLHKGKRSADYEATIGYGVLMTWYVDLHNIRPATDLDEALE